MRDDVARLAAAKAIELAKSVLKMRGPEGQRGERGIKGDPGPIGPMPKHEKKGLQIRFEKSPGVWGDWIVMPVGGGGGGRDDKLFDRQATIVEMADKYKAGELGGGGGGGVAIGSNTAANGRGGIIIFEAY